MTSYEMMSMIFESFSEADPEKTPWKLTFPQHGYKGTVSALRSIVEYKCIERGMIEKVVNIPLMAWGVPGENPIYEHNKLG